MIVTKENQINTKQILKYVFNNGIQLLPSYPSVCVPPTNE